MTKIWNKTKSKSHPAVNKYIIEIKQENDLLPYDIKASIAHVNMLYKVKLLNKNEAIHLEKELQNILTLFNEGTFELLQENEDVHTAIENHLIEKLGTIGKKIHMGRSRNDQVMVATRLMNRDKIKAIQKTLLCLVETLYDFGKKYEFVPMPGYTHYQQAMPSSVGQLTGAYIESLLDDYTLLESAYNYNNQNPLGVASAFGTSFPIDREYTTKLLGFDRPTVNCIYTQNSRGKIESFIASSCTQIMLTLNKIANDMMVFTMQEFKFFTVDQSLTTGSSIMPQKKNLDIMEVLRMKTSRVISAQTEMQMTYQNLLSGYNKDVKNTKPLLLTCFETTQSSLEIVDILFQNTIPNENKLRNSFDREIFATDLVNDMVKNGSSFRDAYISVGDNLDTVETQDIDANLRSKTHLGATGNLGYDYYKKRIQSIRKDAINRVSTIDGVLPRP